MKHFIGGYAFLAIVVFFWCLERAKAKGGDALIAGVVFGWVGGLAAWGLLP